MSIKKVLWNKWKLNNVLIRLENRLGLEKLGFRIKGKSCWMFLLICMKRMPLWKGLCKRLRKKLKR